MVGILRMRIAMLITFGAATNKIIVSESSASIIAR
jgi:hypothetical protein